eukprot:gene40373-49929_t
MPSRLVARRRAAAKPGIVMWRIALAALAAACAVLVLLYPLATLSVLAVVGALVKYDMVRHVKKASGGLSLLAARRPGHSICHFAREFDCHAVDTWVIRAVYETLQDECATQA